MGRNGSVKRCEALRNKSGAAREVRRLAVVNIPVQPFADREENNFSLSKSASLNLLEINNTSFINGG